MAYIAEFSKGHKVKIQTRAFLENFLKTWHLHHPLDPDQLKYADKIARVKSVGMYHGGDQLYTLRGVPGMWHEQCLTPSGSKFWNFWFQLGLKRTR